MQVAEDRKQFEHHWDKFQAAAKQQHAISPLPAAET